MEIRWKEELLRHAQEIMIKGGELKFIVARRGNERIPEIFSYPENRVVCSRETLLE